MLMFMFGNMIFISKHIINYINTTFINCFIKISIYCFEIFFYNNYMFKLYWMWYMMLMIFLLFSVCEGALGLAILVSMIRTHGNDYFQSFSML